MSDIRLFFLHLRYVHKAFRRNPASAFFTLAFPVVFLILFSALFGRQRAEMNGTETSGAAFTLAGIVTASIIGACYTNLGISTTLIREGGFLKRLHGTPLPGWTYLAARIVHAVIVGCLPMTISIAFSSVAYGVRVPLHAAPALLVTLLVAAASFSALGLAITAPIPSATAALAVVNASIWPLLFVSNVFIPVPHPPRWLDLLTALFPVRHFGAAMQYALAPPPGSAGFAGGDLLVLGVWGVAGMIVALRFFSWEPY